MTSFKPLKLLGAGVSNPPTPKPPPATTPALATQPTPKKKKRFQLLDFQQRAYDKGFPLLSRGNSCLLIAGTGLGKTFFFSACASALRQHWIEENARAQVGSGIHTNPSLPKALRPIIILTKTSVIIQTRRVAAQAQLTNIHIISYDQMRASLGTHYLEWKTRVVNGEPVLWPIWKKDSILYPALIIVDECQAVKNEDSLQHKLVLSYIEEGGQVLFSSATPGSRPAHYKCIVIALGLCNAKSWPSYIKHICGARDPMEYSPAAMQRLRDELEPYTIRFENVHYEHKVFIKQLLIDLETPEKFHAYRETFTEYQESRDRAAKNPLSGMAEIFVAILKFRQKSELLRADTLAALAVHADRKENKNVVIATAFQETLKVIHTILVNNYGYKPHEISTIIGGQSDKERQQNIDEFQSEKRHVCLLMFQAGGAGLSLHHTPDNHRPRVAYIPPVWGAEELVQVLGRPHRINSQSTTRIYIVWYNGTIEEQVAAKVKLKCRSMGKMVGARETWVEAFNKGSSHEVDESSYDGRKLIENTKDITTTIDIDDSEQEEQTNLPPIDVEE